MAKFKLTRNPGRGHPRDPPAPVGAARRHQDREGAAATGARKRRNCAASSADRKELTKLVVKEITEDAKKFGDERRTLIEAVAAGHARRGRDPRRTGDGDPLEERLGAHAPGPRHRPRRHRLQDRRLSLSGGRIAHRLAARPHRQQRPSLQPARRRPARRARRRRADQHPGRLPGRRQARPRADRRARSAVPVRQLRRLRLHRQHRRSRLAQPCRQGLHEPGQGRESLLLPAKVGAGGTAAAISASGRLLLFPLAELKTMAKGRGTIIQDIPPKDELAAVAVGDGAAFTVTGIGRGGKPAEYRMTAKELANHRGSRARKGHPIASRIKPTGLAAG